MKEEVIKADNKCTWYIRNNPRKSVPFSLMIGAIAAWLLRLKGLSKGMP